MQQQQQTVVTSPGAVQPMYTSRPYIAASVIDSYRHIQSYVSGTLLIVVGALCIIFGIVETAIISRHYFGGAGYAIICGAMVSIRSWYKVHVCLGKTTELVQCAITGPCLRMRHISLARRLYRFGRFTYV